MAQLPKGGPHGGGERAFQDIRGEQQTDNGGHAYDDGEHCEDGPSALTRQGEDGVPEIKLQSVQGELLEGISHFRWPQAPP